MSLLAHLPGTRLVNDDHNHRRRHSALGKRPNIIPRAARSTNRLPAGPGP